MDELRQLLEGLVQPRRMERILTVLEGRLGSLRVVVEDLHNPHNMSAVLRSCEAMGVQHVHVVDTQSEFKVSRGITKGSHKWLTLHYHDDFAACAEMLKSEGFTLYAAMLSDQALPLGELPCDRKVALVFGNEHAGVSREAEAACDGAFIIPMTGFVQSFNVSVAVSISLYAMTTRMRAEREDGGALTSQEKADLLAVWLPKSSSCTRRIARVMADGQSAKRR